MRLLVACKDCGRQFDATGRQPGSQFRCHCGQPVTIEQPEGHEARVVRCSGCGAPREKASASCRFCRADFTLHERDLNTVCPKCFCRVSDRAKFCHHCGCRLTAESVAGETSELPCPECGKEQHLVGRRLGQVASLECDRCAGLWLGNEVFEHLISLAATESDLVEPRDRPKRARPDQSADLARVDGSAEGKWRYRNCPVCERMMHRRNYGRKSGVIIDQCKDHGIWFDPDELSRILQWVRAGGQARATEEAAAKQEQQERIEQRIGPTRQADRSPFSEEEPIGEFSLPWLLVEVLRGIFLK